MDTTEEKARAYDRVLEKAKSWYVDAQIDFKKSLEALFPELKESDDERIRKALIDYFNDFTLPTFEGLEPKKILAWLEKQGEQKPADEPKFKVGDWIVFNGLTLCIKQVVKGFYITTSKDGITNGYCWDIDNTAKLLNGRRNK